MHSKRYDSIFFSRNLQMSSNSETLMSTNGQISPCLIIKENKLRGLILQILLVSSPCSDYSCWNVLCQWYRLTEELYSNSVLLFKDMTKCLMKNEWMKKDEFTSVLKASPRLKNVWHLSAVRQSSPPQMVILSNTGFSPK